MNFESIKTPCDELRVFESDEIEMSEDTQRLLGHGAFASVYRVKIKNENGKDIKPAALKKLKWEGGTQNNEDKMNWMAQLKREAGIVKRFDHKNIIELYGVCYDDQYFGLLLELCEGESFGIMLRTKTNTRKIPLKVLTDWALQIAEGMAYLNENNYMHRDLKADNVLVKQQVCFCLGSEVMTLVDWCPRCKKRPMKKLHLKITDFGLTKSMMSVGDSVVGTYAWLAPEVFNKNPNLEAGISCWTEYSDVWSFGVVLWEILARELPQKGKDQSIVAFNNARTGQTLVVQEDWNPKFKKIMKKCWTLKPPSKRPRFKDLVEVLKDFAEEIEIAEEEARDVEDPEKRRSTRRDNNSNSNPKNRRHPSILWILGCVGLFLLLALCGIGLVFLLLNTEKCTDGYTYFKKTNGCYKTFLTSLPFAEAFQSCKSQGGDLVSIHSREENTFVANLYDSTLKQHREKVDVMKERSAVWIGLIQKKKWVWSEGSSNQWQNWRAGYPKVDPERHWAILPLAKKMDNIDNTQWINVEETKPAAYTCKKNLIS